MSAIRLYRHNTNASSASSSASFPSSVSGSVVFVGGGAHCTGLRQYTSVSENQPSSFRRPSSTGMSAS